MYIEPNTNIRLIKNCPLDKSQENTIYFTSRAAQTTYFTSTLNGLLFEKNSYQRVNKGKFRIAINAEAIYNYNYLAFQNYSFGDRWFYAFIDKIEYINNVTSEITYTLDIMQTWHFSYELEQCFVEREHSVTDEIGDNIVLEKLDTGEYLSTDFSFPSDLNNMSYVLFCTINEAYDPVDGLVSQDLFSGLYPVTFEDDPDPLDPSYKSGADKLKDWVSHLPITKQEAIVSGCVMPYKLVHRPNVYMEHTVNKNTTLIRSDGTQVKNNKCLTYPYNFLYVTNFQGKSAEYRYEFFDKTQSTAKFYLDGGCNPNPAVFIFPYNYKIEAPSQLSNKENRDEGFYLTGYPQIAWNIDAFKAWLAQSASTLLTTWMTGGAATLATMAGVSLGMGALASPVLPAVALVGMAVNGVVHAAQPPQSKGSTSGASQFQAHNMNFGFMNKHITPEYATIIDDYFSMFGYATNKVKIPNRNARPEWNYVKTIGCKIQGINSGFGGLPADDAEQIEEIYNRGVRFWTNPAHIGNYSYNNAPTIQGGES